MTPKIRQVIIRQEAKHSVMLKSMDDTKVIF